MQEHRTSRSICSEDEEDRLTGLHNDGREGGKGNEGRHKVKGGVGCGREHER